MTAPQPSRLQLWTLRSLCSYAALPCTAADLAAEQNHPAFRTEEYLAKLHAGRWVSKVELVGGALWQPTAKGLRAASAEVQP
ncbi:hypothetical protein [Nocardia sp. NPDC058480]|uniref:hypothetical protein n=1 Tax=unclassified Nocardia TaxID=2637762 RepID=UPI00364ADE30